MKRLKNASTALAVIIGVGGVVVVGVGGAVAAISTNSIHGCVAKSTGALRVIGTSGECKATERAITFNAHGPRGARGDRGPAGPKPETFQMYANVDPNGNLGSNYDAVSAEYISPRAVYVVTFNHAIGSCAGLVQIGKAGGTAASTFTSTVVEDEGPDSFVVQFGTTSGNSTDIYHEPFMLTVTCTT